MKPIYPTTRRSRHADTYHGVVVPDPYRWLEDGTSGERSDWIAAQNNVTSGYLSEISCRNDLRHRFDELLHYPRYYDFVRRAPWLFFKKNDGLKNQLVVQVQRGLRGAPEVLIDPTVLEPDGTLRVTSVTPSRDGTLVAYGLSNQGSDWEEYRIKDMATRRDFPDRVRWVKFSTLAWSGNGFYYSRYPAPSEMGRALSEVNHNHQVWFHRVGSPQSTDALVYKDDDHPFRLHSVQTTEDERFALVTVRDYVGGHSGNALWRLTIRATGYWITPIVTSFDSEFRVIDSVDDQLLVLTNFRAPHSRLVLIDCADPAEGKWETVIPEQGDLLDDVSPLGDHLVVTYRRNACHRLCVVDPTSGIEEELPLSETGLIRLIRGQPQDPEHLWSFSTFTAPPVIYAYCRATRTSSVFIRPHWPFRPGDYEAKQVACVSKDGTEFPMFVVHRKCLTLDGCHPSLLYAYGGNGASVGPCFDPLLVALLERGFVYAVACVRGGGEYGEAWHRAGNREWKQNAFDDCIAAGEWLQAHGYTTRARSALTGSSNGGLLVGAVMTQRPDLFRVALPDVGIMDMLRFQHFTIGVAWTAEYGSSDDSEMFPVLMAYSPLHNLRRGVTYPATLVTTSEQDDRVVPAHSFKFVATLQEMGAAVHPYLIRIETESGHGAVSLPKALEERADVYAFLIANTAPAAPTVQMDAASGFVASV